MRFNKLIEKLLKEASFGRKEFYHGADKILLQSFVAVKEANNISTHDEL